MKKALLVMTLIAFSTSAFAAEFKSSEAILKDFKVYTVKDSKKDEEHLADIIVRVNDAVQYSLKNKPSAALLSEILRVSLITLKNDPSDAVADVLVPLYKAEPTDFKKALDAFPKSEGSRLLEAIKNTIREDQSGSD